jgi:hypothetical protein
MDIDATFLNPVAVELVDNVFPTAIVYHQHGASVYDPTTGTVTGADTDHAIKAGILSRSRIEEGGSNEAYTLTAWIHHGASGLSFLPTTADSFTYDGLVWRIVEIAPAYSSKSLIASKIKGRSA